MAIQGLPSLQQLDAWCLQRMLRGICRPPAVWRDILKSAYAVLAKVMVTRCQHTLRYVIAAVCLTLSLCRATRMSDAVMLLVMAHRVLAAYTYSRDYR